MGAVLSRGLQRGSAVAPTGTSLLFRRACVGPHDPPRFLDRSQGPRAIRDFPENSDSAGFWDRSTSRLGCSLTDRENRVAKSGNPSAAARHGISGLCNGAACLAVRSCCGPLRQPHSRQNGTFDFGDFDAKTRNLLKWRDIPPIMDGLRLVPRVRVLRPGATELPAEAARSLGFLSLGVFTPVPGEFLSKCTPTNGT